MHACTRRVGDDYVGATVFGDEAVGENVLHVACVEQCIGDIVHLAVFFCVFNGFGHIFYADDPAGAAGHEVGYRARPGVEIVDEFLARECGELAGDTV